MYLESSGYGLRKALLIQPTVHSRAGQPGCRHRRSGGVFSNKFLSFCLFLIYLPQVFTLGIILPGSPFYLKNLYKIGDNKE